MRRAALADAGAAAMCDCPACRALARAIEESIAARRAVRRAARLVDRAHGLDRSEAADVADRWGTDL